MRVETEIETGSENDLPHFEKQFTKGKFPLQEAKTLQNTHICCLNSKTEQLLYKNKNKPKPTLEEQEQESKRPEG